MVHEVRVEELREFLRDELARVVRVKVPERAHGERSERSPNLALKEAMKRLILALRSLLRFMGYTNLNREWSSTSTTA